MPREWRGNNGVFSGLAAYGLAFQFKLLGPTDVEQVWGEVVSGNYFDVLGVRLELGRGFLPEEDRVPNRNPVVLISHSLWQRRFSSDPGVVGRSITINNQPLTVVGVAAPQYTGMLHSKWVTLVGRLAPGVSLERARARFEVLSRQMQAAHPDEWVNAGENSARPISVSVLPERETRVHPSARGAAFAVAAIGMYGIVAYSVAQRHREVGIRMALGAHSRDILTLVIQQGMVPVAYGIAAGLALGLVLTRVLVSLPDDAQVLFGVSATDPLTFGGVTAFLGLVALAACYAPARRAARVDPMVTLRDGA